MTRAVFVLLLAVGFLSLLGQVVLLRELAATLYGSELVLILALGAWMTGTALGAFGGRKARAPSPAALHAILCAGAALVVLGIVWCRGARPVLGVVPGAYLPFAKQLATIAAALFPAAAVFGWTFQAAARHALDGGGTLAGAYAAESAGALAGGVAATLALRAGVPNFAAAAICLFAAAAVSLPPGRRILLGLLAGAAAVALLAPSGAVDHRMTAWTHPHLRAARDTPYGRAVLTASEGQIAVFQDDVLAFETQGTAAEEFVHPVALQLARVESVLILGGGSSGLIAEALAYHPRRVESVEVDRAFHELVMDALPESTRTRMLGGVVVTAFEDPRRYVRRAASRGAAYDLVLVGEPEPSSGRTNRLYTREFFAQCAAVLGERGVLALRLPSAENYWIAPLVRRTASIERALRAVFPSVLVLPGANTLLVASRAPLVSDPEKILARWDARDLHPRLTTPAYIRYLYTNDRVTSVAAQLAAAKVPVNSDRHPVCYPYTLMIWLAKFHPAFARLDPIAWASSPAAALLAAVISAFIWWIVRRASSRRWSIVVAAGASGMLLESVLLLAFQSRDGVLYEDLGLLLGLFMAGLTAGAWAVHVRARHARSPRAGGRRGGLAIVAALFLASVAVAVRLRAGALPGLAETAAGLFLAGALTAAVFAHASLGLRDAARGAGAFYAADLSGGVLGCVIGSLLMIPVLGLPGTALAAAVLAVAAATWM